MKSGIAVNTLRLDFKEFLSGITRLSSELTRSVQGRILHFRLIELLVTSQIIYFSWEWGIYLPKISSIAYPVGLANYVDVSLLLSFHNSWINAGLITILVLMGFLRYSKYSYTVALLFVHLQYVARFSVGKVGHGSVLPGLMFLSIALATIFFSSEKDRAEVGMFLMLFFAGLAYDAAAFCKLFASGLSWVQGDHLWMWMQENIVDQLSANGTVHLNYGIATKKWTVS